ncbi:PHP domain-containing protein [bacterium]|nr:PHP domain-containing protein [bacterium]
MKSSSGNYVDLHVHSSYSDGSFTPGEVLDRARAWNLKAISITDHDTVEGTLEALQLASSNTIEVIPGIEFSTTYNNYKVHILAYFFDPLYPPLQDALETLRKDRYQRANRIVNTLNDMHIDISFEEVEECSGKGCIGRPHIAALLTDKGITRNVTEAFEMYIGDGKAAFYPKKTLSIEKVLNLTHEAGGIAVLAHPGKIGDDDLASRLCEMDLNGLEAFYPGHTRAQTEKFIQLAADKNIAVTGGSDCHGMMKGEPILGLFKVDAIYLDLLKKKHREIKRNYLK